jgi:ParB-like chromosome segregation protein Spo0J
MGESNQSALAVIMQPLRDLVPYAKNARTHSPEQIKKVRASLHRFGWTNPILVADRSILAGHARHRAAIAMAEEDEDIPRNPDPWQAPTIDLSHLPWPERRAYIIADNRIAEDAGWDRDLLRSEMGDLMAIGLDLSLTGFAPPEISEILVPPGEPEQQPERNLTAAENDAMDRAWQQLTSDWQNTLADARTRGWISPNLTKGSLAVHYLRAMFLGTDIPRTATLAYVPDRLWTAGDKRGDLITGLLAQSCDNTADGRQARDRLRWILAERPAFEAFCGGTSLPALAYRIPNDFPALLARDLINEFTHEPAARILDPCHGWGGRMLGFLLADRAASYHGFDPSPPAHAGVQAMFDDLVPLTPLREKHATLELLPYEQASLDQAAYDFALTSPPYFDVERYDGEQQSHRIYPSFEAWTEGFYAPLMEKTANALKPRAIFALQVGSQSYPLARTAAEIASRIGLAHVETRKTDMVNNRTGTTKDQGEVVMLFRKPR